VWCIFQNSLSDFGFLREEDGSLSYDALERNRDFHILQQTTAPTTIPGTIEYSPKMMGSQGLYSPKPVQPLESNSHEIRAPTENEANTTPIKVAEPIPNL
jgi:hypothetical protein